MECFGIICANINFAEQGVRFMATFKKIVVCVLCIGLCYLLPMLFHPMNLGRVLSPMHVPVIVCGLACGPGYGTVCAILGPIICSALTGLPGTDMLPTMLPELVTYAAFAGLVMRKVHIGSLYISVLLTLVPTILFGRAAAILATGVYHVLGVFGVESFSIGEAFATYFSDATTTIAVQFVFIPLLVVTRKEEKLLKF